MYESKSELVILMLTENIHISTITNTDMVDVNEINARI